MCMCFDVEYSWILIIPVTEKNFRNSTSSVTVKWYTNTFYKNEGHPVYQAGFYSST